MRQLFYLAFVFMAFQFCSAQIDKELLVNLHEVATTVEMNAILNSKKGDLVHNIEAKAIYVFNGATWVTGTFNHTPYLTIESEIELGTNTTKTILISGVDFTIDTQIAIPGLTINNFSILSPTIIEVNITTTATSGYYDIIVNNAANFNTSWPDNEKDKIHVL